MGASAVLQTFGRARATVSALPAAWFGIRQFFAVPNGFQRSPQVERPGGPVRSEAHGFVEPPGLRIATKHPERYQGATARLQNTLTVLAEQTTKALTPVLGRQVNQPDLAGPVLINVGIAATTHGKEAKDYRILFREVRLFGTLRESLAEMLSSVGAIQSG